MWNYTIKAEVITGRFSRQVETFSVQANNLTDAMVQIEKNAKIGRVIHSTSVKNKDNKMEKLQSRLAEQQHQLGLAEIMGNEFFIQHWKEKITETLAKIEALKSN